MSPAMGVALLALIIALLAFILQLIVLGSLAERGVYKTRRR